MKRWLFVAFIVLCSAVGRLSYLARPFDSDAAMFIYEGKSASQGERFGVELCDNKFPSVGLMTGLCWRMFGTRWGGYIALPCAMMLAGALVLAQVARRYAGDFAALATFLCAITYMNFGDMVFGGFQLETPMAFFAILSAAFCLEAVRNDRVAPAFVAGL